MLEDLIKQAALYNIAVDEKDTVETLTAKLAPVNEAINAAAEDAVSSIEDIEGKEFKTFTINKVKYKFTTDKFIFKGEEYKTETLTVKDNKDLLAVLIKTESFVIKKV